MIEDYTGEEGIRDGFRQLLWTAFSRQRIIKAANVLGVEILSGQVGKTLQRRQVNPSNELTHYLVYWLKLPKKQICMERKGSLGRFSYKAVVMGFLLNFSHISALIKNSLQGQPMIRSSTEKVTAFRCSLQPCSKFRLNSCDRKAKWSHAKRLDLGHQPSPSRIETKPKKCNHFRIREWSQSGKEVHGNEAK